MSEFCIHHGTYRCPHCPAPQPPALCAKVIDGEPCSIPESEPPHGKMSGHKFQPPADATLPAHLREDAPYRQCSKCGRKTWSPAEFGQRCAMLQPNGPLCDGRFPPVAPPITGDGDAADDAEVREILACDGLPDPSIPVYVNDRIVSAVRAGLARGRALGAREALDSLATTMKADLNRYTLNKHAREWIPHFLEAIEARRAGRGGK